MNAQAQTSDYDLAIIGSGFHGISIAREARRRGLQVALIHNQSILDCSSIPYHAVIGADIRKIESLNFTEVISNQKELLHLHALAPHLVNPIASFVAKNPKVRANRLVSFGLRSYKSLQRKAHKSFERSEQKAHFTGVEPDSLFPIHMDEFLCRPMRMLVEIAQSACSSGVRDYAYHELIRGERHPRSWSLGLRNTKTNENIELNCKALLNCTTCSIDKILQDKLGVSTRCRSRKIDSAWLYINKPQQWDQALLLQQKDKSLVYVFPVDKKTLCAGPLLVDASTPYAQQAAVEELLSNLNSMTQFVSTADDIVRCQWHTTSVIEDPSSKLDATYNEAFVDLNTANGQAPVLSIFGSNIAQFKKIAKECLLLLQDYLPPYATTENSLVDEFNRAKKPLEIKKEIESAFPQLNSETLERLYQSYGNKIQDLLPKDGDLGQHFGCGLYAAEVDYLRQYEWVNNVEELLWRNSHLSLLFDSKQKQTLHEYFEQD